MSIRKKFIGLSSAFSGLLPLSALQLISGQNFILPFYHVVSDEPCPHINNLYRFKDSKEFERDLDYLTAHYQPISADDLPDVLTGKYRDKKIMLLTFDDGLRQVYDVIAPILLRKGMPAIFFVNTDFIDNKALMFRYKASLIKNMDKDTSAMFDARNDKELDNEIPPESSDEIKNEIDTFLKGYKPYMSTDQIRALIDQGFAIGAHSCSHPYYEDLTLDQQLSETQDCMSILQRTFGAKHKLFAFPFTDHGVSTEFFERIFDGGTLDFSFGGAGIKLDVHPRQFQRIPMEGWDAGAEQVLKSEYLYYALRIPLFKNKIKRN
jgi:peptidoglycan/xylan/chitin deacetylase (PgdA/CDA1 family)